MATSAPAQGQPPQERKTDVHFRDRIVVTGPFTKPYEIDPRQGKKVWPWETIWRIPSESFDLPGTQKLSGGMCSVKYDAAIECQANIEYVQTLDWLRAKNETKEVLDGHTPDRIKARVKNTIEHELATTHWEQLGTEAGVEEAEQRIKEAVRKELEFNNFGGMCHRCHLSEPTYHGPVVSGTPAQFNLSFDSSSRLKAETHNRLKEELTQQQQQAGELESLAQNKLRAEATAKAERQRILDEAERLRRAAAASQRTEVLEADTQEKKDARARQDMIDTHDRAVLLAANARKEIEASEASKSLIAGWERSLVEKQKEMELEAKLRQKRLESCDQDGKFVAHETDMLKLALDRARIEQEMADIQRRGAEGPERGAIQLLRERMNAEHAWEIDRLEGQGKVLAQALEKIGATSQPIERLTVMNQSSGEAGPLPNSPAFLLAQAALTIREMLSFFG